MRIYRCTWLKGCNGFLCLIPSAAVRVKSRIIERRDLINYGLNFADDRFNLKKQ